MPYTTVAPRVTNIIDRTVQRVEQEAIDIVRNDFVRSPKTDCFVTVPKLIKPKTNSINLKVHRAVSDYDISEIHQIDLEAFKYTDPVPSNLFQYKQTIKELKSYIIKNNSGKTTGYYQTEPVKNGLLYIYSIGIPKELRGTKTSFYTLMKIKESITEIAKAENVQKLGLHVDSKNEPLVKMYKKFGFEVKETEPNYYLNGDSAYYMEAKIEKKQDTDINKPGYVEQRTRKKQIYVDVSQIKKNNQLEHYLLSIRDDDGEALFPRREIRKILNSRGKPSVKAEFVSKLISIKKLSGYNIAQMVASVETAEQVQARAEFIVQASKFDKITPVILTKTAHLINTKEMALFKLEFMDELAKKYELTEKETYQIINSAGNKESAKVIYKALSDKNLGTRIRNIENITGLRLYANTVRGDNTYNHIDDKKLIELHKFMQENKSLIQSYGYQRVTNEEVDSLFKGTAILEALDIIDFGTIKYAMKLKYAELKEFIYKVAGLKEKIGEEHYSKLKQKMNEFIAPAQKFDRIQIINSLNNTKNLKQIVEELIALFKSNKVTDEQQKAINGIFASKRPYKEQIQEFFQKIQIPDDKKEKIESFLAPLSCEEQLAIVNKQIQELENNQTVTETRKNMYKKALEQKKEEIISNPEETGRLRPNSKKMKEFIQEIETVNAIENNKQINDFLEGVIYKSHNIEPTPELLSTIRYDEKYKSLLMMQSYRGSQFSKEFKKLIDLIKINLSKPLSELRETLVHNNETKKLFEQNGLNYQKWIKFDKDSYYSFGFETNTQDATRAVSYNIVKELSGDLFKSVEKINKVQTDKLIKALMDGGYKIDMFSITRDGQEVDKKDLEKLINILKDEINLNSEFWGKPLVDERAESVKNELVDHILGIHRKAVADLQAMADTKMDLQVRLSDDDDVGRNLFLGNHVGCCTSIGGSNAFAAPQHLMNTFVRAMEIVDKRGNSYGNSMCYFAKVDDKLSFIIDSFEANGKLGSAKEVTDAIIAYSKQVTKEMAKSDNTVDIPIYFGPNYNKINLSKLEKTPNHNVEVIGRMEDHNHTYIDVLGGHSDVKTPRTERSLYNLAT